MQLPGPEVTATWPPPNYDSPDSQGPALIIVEAISMSLVLICISLRFFVKLVILERRPQWDDWLMVLSVIFALALTILVILANTIYGWNHHLWDLRFAELITARKVSLAAQVLYLCTTSLAKISILLSYLNLAPQQTYFRSLSQVAIVVIALGNTSFFVVLFTQCIPTSSYWDILRINQDCHIRESHVLMAQAVMTVLADLAVWLLPLWTFYHARLPLSQRVALIVLFSFGAVVVVAACLRTYWLWWAVGVTWDVTWECRNEWIWTAVEAHLGIICGCVPWMKSFVNLWNKKEREKATQRFGSEKEVVSPGGRRPSGVGRGRSPGYSFAVNDVRWNKDDDSLDMDLEGIELQGQARRSFGGV